MQCVCVCENESDVEILMDMDSFSTQALMILSIQIRKMLFYLKTLFPPNQWFHRQ